MIFWERGDRAERFDKLGANYILEATRADVVSRDMVARSFSIATFAKVAKNRRWRGLRPMAYRSMDQLHIARML